MDNMDVDSPGPLYVRLLARAPIYDLIFACLSPRTLVRLSLTCRIVYEAIAEFKTRAFSINRHLSRYFTNPIAFRSLQARTNTLISGSTALQFFDRTFYPESDLDLYTHPGHSLEVAQFLVRDEGYRYVPGEDQEDDWEVATSAEQELTAPRRGLGLGFQGSGHHAYTTTSIRAVWTFEKAIHADPQQERRLAVQIVEAFSSPLESILGFHSPCVMNFISSDAAYALYPTATFEHRVALALPRSHSSQEAIEKYASRGWRIYFIPMPKDQMFLLDQARWVSDKHTWILPLDQTGVQARPPPSQNSAPLPCDPVLFNGWALKPCMRKDEGLVIKSEGYKPHYYPLKSTVFRYNYALPDEVAQSTIRAWAHRQGRAGHVQLSKEEWAWFDSDIPHFLQMVVKPNRGDSRITRVELVAQRASA